MPDTSSKHRIALLAGRFVPTSGGLESWTHDLAVELAARGHTVRVLTTEASVSPPGVAITLVPASPRLIPQARLFASAAQALTDHIIHDTGAGLAADIFQPQMGCRILNLQRDDAGQSLPQRVSRFASPRHWRWKQAVRRLERTQLTTARCVIAVSRDTAAAFRDRYGVPDSRIRLIPNGIDTSRFHPDHCLPLRQPARRNLKIPPDTFVLLAAAGNFRLKGVHHAIAALAVSPHALLLVAGQGDIAAFSALARHLGVADRVRFLGLRGDMPALFAAADVFIHLTAHDACSLATLEAMACGLPVITTRRNGAADGMTDGREGFVLDPQDTCTVPLFLLRDPARRAAMGKAARLLAEQHDFMASVTQLEAIYDASRHFQRI